MKVEELKILEDLNDKIRVCNEKIVKIKESIEGAKTDRTREKWELALVAALDEASEYQKEYKKIISDYVRYAARLTDSIHVNTIKIREIKKGIEDAERIHKLQQEEEMGRLKRHTESHQNQKELLERVKKILNQEV